MPKEEPTHALVFKEYGGGQYVTQIKDLDGDPHIEIITTGTREECLGAMNDQNFQEKMEKQEGQQPTPKQEKYFS